VVRRAHENRLILVSLTALVALLTGLIATQSGGAPGLPSLGGHAGQLRSQSTTNESFAVLGTPAIVSWPAGVAVDTANNRVFVTGQDSDNVSVINGTTGQPIGASISTPSEPWGIAYDSDNGLLYVSDFRHVTIINGTTDTDVGNLSVYSNCPGIAFDPVNGDIYVADYGPNGTNDTISIINGTSNTVITDDFPVGSQPFGIGVDPATDLVYVANAGSNNLTVINGSTNMAQDRNLSVNGSAPSTVLFDAATNDLYIANQFSDNLTVFNATTNEPVGRGISVPKGTDPWGLALDPTNGNLFVGGEDTGNVTVVDPTSGRVLDSNISIGSFEGQGVQELAFDNASGVVYAVDPTSDEVAEIAGGEQFQVRFNATGLPSGAKLNVTLGPDHNSTRGSSVSFWEGPGTYDWSIQPIPGYTTRWTGHVVVSDGPVVVFENISRTTYPVTFEEEGLPEGTPWYVNFTAAPSGVAVPSTGPILNASGSVALSNGSYAWSAQAGGVFSDKNLTGTVAENSGSSTPPSPIVLNFGLQNYTTTFEEMGLPTGTEWYLNLTSAPPGFELPGSQSSAGATILLPLANGSYSYTAQTADRSYATQEGRTLQVSGSTTVPAQPIDLLFVPVQFGVTFDETGLPGGITWQLSLNGGAPSTTTGSTITLALTNGTYDYYATADGYVSTSSTTRFTVNGGPPDPLVVTFTAIQYAVTFDETGLPSGMHWNVTLGGITRSSDGSNVTFGEPDGLYAYVVPAVTGYSVSPPSGSVNVSGQNRTVSLPFVATEQGPGLNSNGPPRLLGLPAWQAYLTVAAAVVVAALGVGFVVLRQRRKPPTEGHPDEPALEWTGDDPPPECT
jgi:YVTN family beta-propeller protein